MLENEEIEEPTIKPVKEIFQTFFKSYSAVTGLVILIGIAVMGFIGPVSCTHLRAHETR